jgi:hypothetical protein
MAMNREEFIDAAFAELRRIESGQATVHMIAVGGGSDRNRSRWFFTSPH